MQGRFGGEERGEHRPDCGHSSDRWPAGVCNPSSCRLGHPHQEKERGTAAGDETFATAEIAAGGTGADNIIMLRVLSIKYISIVS